MSSLHKEQQTLNFFSFLFSLEKVKHLIFLCNNMFEVKLMIQVVLWL